MVDGKKPMKMESKTANKKIFKVLGARFELPINYDILNSLGTCAHGTVVVAK